MANSMSIIFCYRFILILSSTFIMISCEQHDEDRIVLEYKELASKNSKKIKDISIEVLTTRSTADHSLAKEQIQLLEQVIRLRKNEIRAITKMDSVILLRILNRDCRINALTDEEEKKQYKLDNRQDSLILKRNEQRFIKAKLSRLEDEVKVLHLRKILSRDSIEYGQNIMIKHKVSIALKDKSITDTLYYLSFNSGAYSYLNRNVFLEN